MTTCIAALALVGAALGAWSCEGEVRNAREALGRIVGGAVLGAAFGIFTMLLSGPPDSSAPLFAPDISLTAKIVGLAFVGAVIGYLADWGEHLKPLGERVAWAFLGASEDGTPRGSRVLFAVVGAIVGASLGCCGGAMIN